jgi:hypothetical protein
MLNLARGQTPNDVQFFAKRGPTPFSAFFSDFEWGLTPIAML